MIGEIAGQMGGLAWTVAAFIIALSIIVGVHEYGHYIVGRWSGIRAEVFSLGFGPRLFSRRDRRGTLWQVAAIPLGGYVRFLGDADVASATRDGSVDPGVARQTLGGAPLWARFATVAAGPFFNFILAAAVFAGVVMWQGLATDRVVVGEIAPAPPGIVNELRPGDEVLAVGGQPVTDWASLFRLAEALPPAPQQPWTVRRGGDEITVTAPDVAPPRVSGVGPRSAASAVDLRPGDVILAVEGRPITRFTDLRPTVEAAQGRPVTLRVWREDAGEADFVLVPREQDLPRADGGFEKRWLIGVTGGEGYIRPATRTPDPFEALWMGAQQTWDVIWGSLTGLVAMVTGQIGRCNLSGAISIAEVAGDAASSGAGNFFWLVAVLSAGIGFLNLLPIPVLDGGHLAFYTWEAVAGRPPSPRVMDVLTRIGVALVLALMFFGLSNDILCR
ncbi:RIP metalloprotease RseP [Paracoccus sp. (in: a-proteobacteria)]|uniref:RIP metalloprotease RseP n=1 Tax=Paracoccus sp. TaxID=267 RepID=UPI0026DF1F64|nr:RIP metalloprotease RseP [Paracoccus sp. (in: a-proteobacteria)]MDO5369091.1 RIP metalloprotease RseP [Paracoccus sp. (in: a-proteobacteria)]